MQRRLGWLSLSIIIAIFSVLALLRLPQLVHGQPDPGGVADYLDSKIGSQISDLQAAGNDEETVRYIIFISSDSTLNLDSLPDNKEARRAQIVSNLKETAESAQAAVRNELDTLEKAGLITRYNPLWIVNAIAVTGTAESMQLLAARPDVEHIELDQAHRYFDDPQLDTSQYGGSSLAKSNDETAWGVERIQAPKVWKNLGIKGEGVTVAIVDTGVDLNHPDLFTNYRGNLGFGNLEHKKNWFNAAVPTSTVPFDFHGHGTHVAGSAVGRNGIGVAPGAKWIAVAIADDSGLIYDSSIHAAFQWLLAPGGDPGAAPDVANNSWGGAGTRVDFEQDLQILRAAGIITVFAAGNEGSLTGTILSPASYPNTISVGASDDQDQLAWFSGRGPSPLTADIKPLIIAPGTQILSAQPGGSYIRKNGTSMATPHVVGAIALLLSADPQMSEADIVNTLANTADPIAPNQPNMNSGYGILDAFSAVLSRKPHGTLSGILINEGEGIANVRITIHGPDSLELTGLSDQNGRYSFLLPQGEYQVSTHAFSYHDLQITGIKVKVGQEIFQESELKKQPAGQVHGLIKDDQGPIANATITIAGTPITLKTNAKGQFQSTLPSGTYLFIYQAVGHLLEQKSIQIIANQDISQEIELDYGPSILVIDSGQWLFESASSYYLDALQDNRLSGASWVIDDPHTALPTLEDLIPYQIVIWSAPTDSPSRLSLSDVLSRYLDQGGTLLISGQNLASLDGQPGFEDGWFRTYLDGEFTGELDLSDGSPDIEGSKGTQFFGLNIGLNGHDSAGNQVSPDLVKPRDKTFTDSIFETGDGSSLGLKAGFCEKFRIVYLGFGLEGVSRRSDRAELLRRSIKTLLEPRSTLGARWLPDQEYELVLPGERINWDLEVQNLSEIITDTFELRIENNPWNGTLLTKTLQLRPCALGQTALAVDIPEDAQLDTNFEFQLTAVSKSNPDVKATFQLHLKTPGKFLLVDDDRFYDGAPAYTSALDTLNLAYDIWDTTGQNLEPNSPSSDFLNAYDSVLWFTGYDWHQPITKEENAALARYLRQGGKLFLSSQDYLFYNLNTSLSRELGILDYQESVTPTLVYGEPALSFTPDLVGPLPLSYDPYQNFSDGIIPAAGTSPFLWNDKGTLAGVANNQGSNGRSLFWAFPFETLPTEQQPAALAAALTWLSDLGGSTFSTDKQRGTISETRSFTLTVMNDDKARLTTVVITNTLPQGLNLVPESLDSDITYSPDNQQIKWHGRLGPGQKHQISYKARLDLNLEPGTKLVNHAVINHNNETLSLEKFVPLWVNVPDLSQSELRASTPPEYLARVITYSLILKNDSIIPASNVTATLSFPESLKPLTQTLGASAGNIILDAQKIFWNGSVTKEHPVTATIVLTRSTLFDYWLPAGAVIEDNFSDPIILHDLQYLPPYQFFFPYFAIAK